MMRRILFVAGLALLAWLPPAAHAQPPTAVGTGATAATPAMPTPAPPAAASSSAPAGAAATAIPPDPTADLGGYARAVIDAIRGGRWMVTFGLVLVGLVAAARRGLGQLVPWFKTDRGGTVLASATAAMAVLGSGLAAGVPFGADLLSAALAAAAGAIGLFTAAKRLVAPSDRRPSAAESPHPGP